MRALYRLTALLGYVPFIIFGVVYWLTICPILGVWAIVKWVLTGEDDKDPFPILPLEWWWTYWTDKAKQQ